MTTRLDAHGPEFHKKAPVKVCVRVATTTAGTLASSFENGDTVDGITLATGDRILLKNQSTGSENGIYIVAASGAPARAYDMDTSAEVQGTLVYVLQGTTNAGTLWANTNTGTVTLGSTALTFAKLAPSTATTSFGTPSVTYGTPAAGAASTAIRTDATLAKPTEADLSLSDVTTGNVSTSKHGFAPKGDGSTTKFLNANGAYSTPSGTSLEVKEADGTPDVTGVTTIIVSNGTLTDNGSGSVTITTGGGGGSGNLAAPSAVSVDLGASNLLVRQATSNTEDDLFDSSPLNAKWLAFTGYNATTDLTIKPGWCKITADGAKLQAVPAGDWTIEGEFIPAASTTTAFTTGGLILTNGTIQSSATEARVSIGLNNSADQTRVFFEKFVNGAFSSTYKQDTATVGGVLPWVMRITKSGTTYSLQFGNTREGLQFFFSTSSLGFTPTHFGFHGSGGVYINGFYRL